MYHALLTARFKRPFTPLAIILTLGMVLVLSLTACTPPLHKQQSYVFGTLVDVTIYGEEPATAQRVTAQIFKDFDALHRTLHPWEAGTLERINGVLALASPDSPAKVSLPPGVIPLLQDASRLSEQSEGLFNPAIGNLVRLWGFHSDTFAPRLPDAAAVQKWVQANPRMADLHMEGLQLVGHNPAVRIDLGGYAKGYALDMAAAYLKSQGVNHALINIGGNVMALGKKGQDAWKIGIQHPRRAGALATLSLHDGEAVGTSGDYQRYFEINGKRYSHLIDPRTGWPANQAQAVTVLIQPAHASSSASASSTASASTSELTKPGVLSDVASKPLFIAGPADWPRLAKQMGIKHALFVRTDGTIDVTRAFNERLSWEKPVSPVHVIE